MIIGIAVIYGRTAQAQSQANSAPVPAASASSAPTRNTDPTYEAQRVEVTSTALQDDRRDSATAKIVVTREDLDKYGDANAADVLRRVPGISIFGSGRTTEIRMRGLGGGYTQILINGEPAPDGFSVDGMSPNLIDHIDVQRSPSLEQSARGIAGTINIVLRQATTKPTRELKLSEAGHAGNPATYLDGLYSDRSGAWTYSLAGSASRERNRFDSVLQQDAFDTTGVHTFSNRTDRSEWYLDDTLGLTPTLKWKPSPTRSVSLESFIRVRDTHAGSTDVQNLLFGTPPLYDSDNLHLKIDTTLWRNRLSWHEDLANEASLDAKAGFTINRRISASKFYEFDPSMVVLLDEDVHSTALERSVSSSGKYRVPFIQSHAAAIGWDGEAIERDENRLQTQSAPPGYPAKDLDEDYNIHVNRLALYAQDEWDISKQMSVYWGARWEVLSTKVTGNVIDSVANQSSVLSPVVQSTWKIPGTSNDQVRAGLSRTYNAPMVRDLNPRRFVSNDNTPTTPDVQGNPDLRAELAWGLDLAYEHYLGKSGGLVSVSAFARHIDNVIVRTTSEQNGEWISIPQNLGSAEVQGLGLEVKMAFAEIDKAWPALDVHGNINWNHSTVSSVPGPDNRLAKQTPFTMGFGADYKLPGTQCTVGSNFTFDGGGPIQISAGQREDPRPKRNLDAYASWKIDTSTRLRFSGSNLLAQTTVVDDSIADGAGVFQQRTFTNQSRTWKAAIEHKF